MRGPELGPETSMEGDVLDTLEALGYKGPLLEEQALSKAAEGGLSSPEFSELCVWLGSQIKSLCSLEESIASAGIAALLCPPSHLVGKQMDSAQTVVLSVVRPLYKEQPLIW